MSDSSSKRPHAGVGGAYYPFSMPDETRESISAPTEREGGPVMRRVIGAAPVSRPARTQTITEHYAAAGVDWLTVLDKWLLWSAVVYCLWVVQ